MALTLTLTPTLSRWRRAASWTPRSVARTRCAGNPTPTPDSNPNPYPNPNPDPNPDPDQAVRCGGPHRARRGVHLSTLALTLTRTRTRTLTLTLTRTRTPTLTRTRTLTLTLTRYTVVRPGGLTKDEPRGVSAVELNQASSK
eukprot:scaffold120061_cov53-Phaeocystis_antarctica.AAC.3